MGPRARRSLIAVTVAAASGLAAAVSTQSSTAAAASRHRAVPLASGAGHSRSQFTKRLVAGLKRDGFMVNPGYARLYTQADCEHYTYPALKNCFLNNPAAPYVSPIVRTWPGQYVNPATVDAFGPAKPGYTSTYRLDPRDAIVMYGKMPPPGRYMGLQTFEFSQHGRWTARNYLRWARTPNRPVPMQYLFDTIPPGDRRSGRTISVSALGNIVNNVVMQRRSGYSFGKNRYFITTPSITTGDAVRRELHALGVPARDVFIEPIPGRDSYGRIGPLGMGKNAIDFLTTFRYAVPDPGYQQAADRWREHPPLSVLDVRAPASAGPVRRYGRQRFGKRTANSEAYLAGDLRKLIRAVCARVVAATHLRARDCGQPPPASSLMPNLVGRYGWIGPYCREINMDCLGDQQDAAYYVSRPLPLDSGQVYAVVDTLATETGNATYAALSVNNAAVLEGVTNVLDTMLKGSADGYSSGVRHSGEFFVHYYTRNCAVLRGVPGWRDNCTQITDQMVPPHGDTSAQGDPALHGTFMASLRDYVKPGTTRGPDPRKLLTPRVLAFTRR